MNLSNMTGRPGSGVGKKVDADVHLSRCTVSFSGMRLPQSVLPTLDLLDSTPGDGQLGADALRGLVAGELSTRLRLRERATRAAAIAEKAASFATADQMMYWQPSVLDLVPPEGFTHPASQPTAGDPTASSSISNPKGWALESLC